MAAFNELNVITDPDELGYEVNPVSFAAGTEEILIFTGTKKIALKVTGNLTIDGASIKAVYSKLKDAWRANVDLIKFPFPMGPITDEQFELINGWNWDQTETSGAATQTTVELLRTGGWSVVSTAGDINELWTSVITLGSLGATDQVYYQQLDSDADSVNFTLTGKVNQAVRIYYYDGTGTRPDVEALTDADAVDGTSAVLRRYLKLFVREWEKLYAQSEIFDIGVSQLTYQAYRFPLTNSADLKIKVTAANIVAQLDANSDGVPDTGVYNNVKITYLRDANNELYNILATVANTTYAVGDVVQEDNGAGSQWYECTTAGTVTNSVGTAQAAWTGTAVFTAYTGQRLIGTSWYPFSTIVDGDTTVGSTVSGSARTDEIYTAVQYFLRQNIDIDLSGGLGVAPIVTGKTASALLRFVGDTLVTSTGVYVDSFNTQDTNAITFVDAKGVARTFPYVASLTVNFGTNLQNDQYSKYWVFFTNANGNLFGSTNAIIVNDAVDSPMTGVVNPAWPTKRTSVSHSFNYDSNVQGGRTAANDADITVVGIGLSTGQYVSATSTIARSTANSATLTASLERNYAQGGTYP